MNLKDKIQQAQEKDGASLSLFAGGVLLGAAGFVCILAAVAAGSVLAAVGAISLIGVGFCGAYKGANRHHAIEQRIINLDLAEMQSSSTLQNGMGSDFDYAAAAASSKPVETMRPIKIKVKPAQLSQ